MYAYLCRTGSRGERYFVSVKLLPGVIVAAWTTAGIQRDKFSHPKLLLAYVVKFNV